MKERGELFNLGALIDDPVTLAEELHAVLRERRAQDRAYVASAAICGALVTTLKELPVSEA